jgi:multiple sugar transport system permease protein
MATRPAVKEASAAATVSVETSADTIAVPQAPSIPVSRKLRWARAWRRNRFPYALIAPTILFMCIVHFIPMMQGLYTSFLGLTIDWHGQGNTLRELYHAPWAGLENYRDVFTEKAGFQNDLQHAAWNTVKYTALSVLFSMAGAMILALLLNREFFGRRVARTLTLAPWTVPTFITGVLWSYIFYRDTGILNKTLMALHLTSRDNPMFWLSGPNALWALVIATVWRGLPFAMLVFLAGMQGIPEELYEAASIDGAGSWRRFWMITFPLLRPLLAIQILFGVIFSIYQYTIPVTMLSQGGSGYPGRGGDLIMTAVIRATFNMNNWGVGAAVSTMMMIAMMLWIAVWYMIFRRDLEMA